MRPSTTSLTDRPRIAPVTTREQLVFLLSRASELEHGLACVYLFAAHSQKNDASERGLTDDKRRWSGIGSGAIRPQPESYYLRARYYNPLTGRSRRRWLWPR